MSTKHDFKPLFTAAAAAGSASAKVGTEVAKLLKSKRRSQADTIKAAAYAEYLGERKARDLSEADRRTYDAMRQGFSRYYSKQGWKRNNNNNKPSDGFALQFTRGVKPETVVKGVKTLAEYLRAEYKDNEKMLRLAAFLADIE